MIQTDSDATGGPTSTRISRSTPIPASSDAGSNSRLTLLPVLGPSTISRAKRRVAAYAVAAAAMQNTTATYRIQRNIRLNRPFVRRRQAR